MKKIKALFAIAILFMLFLRLPATVLAEDFTYALDTDGELVIVIDPGHGGANLGADYNGFLEKEMNMVVANAMYVELSKYEGVTIYMTHTSADTDMSIQERAQFAASVNADFLFCLHFNMSIENKLFGSEVWVSAFGEQNREGYRFGSVQMDTMKDMGLFLRGVKTRLGDNGDYYGILRYCKEFEIPAALIEHCHIDHETDVGFCDEEEDLIAFGVADATSVAKYFRLKSTELGVDYSDYEVEKLTPGSLYVQADTSDPDICVIEEAYIDVDTNKLGVTVTAVDYDSPMLYYSYSIDGGETFTPYLPWPDTDVMTEYSPDTITLDIDVPEGISPFVVVRAINQYDRYTESNMLTGLPVFMSTPDETPIPEVTESPQVTIEPADSEYTGFKAPVREEVTDDTVPFSDFLKLCLIAAGALVVVILITNLMIAGKKRQRRRKKRR